MAKKTSTPLYPDSAAETRNRSLLLRVVQPDGRTADRNITKMPIHIGRGKENEIVLEDENVSRNHSEIYLVGNQFFIRDCESLNGIRLNGETVLDAAIAPGDYIELGLCEIQCLSQSGSDPHGNSEENELLVRPSGTGGVLEVIRDIDLEKLLSGKEDPIQQILPASSSPHDNKGVHLAVNKLNKAYTNLMVIMDLVSKVGGYSHPKQVAEQFASALKTVFPLAESVAVIEFDADNDMSLRLLNEEGIDPDVISSSHPSQTVLQRVREEIRALYAVDARKDPRFHDVDSVRVRGVRSMMCAPLVIRGEVRGAIYVENLTQPYCFGQFDLSFLTVFAFHLAIALETSHLLAERDKAFERAVESIKAVKQDKTALLLQYSQSERKFRALFEQSALGAAVINLVSGKIEEVNDGLVQMLGFGRRQINGLNFWHLLDDQSQGRAEKWMLHIRQNGEGTFKARLRSSSGSILIAMISCRALRLGESFVMAAYFIDITAKEQAEAQTKTQLARVTALSELSRGLMTTLDSQAIYRLLYQKVQAVLPVERLIIGLFLEEDKDQVKGVFSAFRDEDGTMVLSNDPRNLPIDSSLVDHLQSMDESAAYFSAVSDNNEEEVGAEIDALNNDKFLSSTVLVPMVSRHHVQGIVCVQSSEVQAYDSSHVETLRALVAQAALALTNARAFNEIQEQEISLRRLSLQTMTAQETERGRISRELHDGVGQQLTAMKYIIESIKKVAKSENKDSLMERIGDAGDLAKQIIEELRSISLDLRPTMLDDLGLEPTLEWLTRQYMNNHQIEVQLSCNIEEDQIAMEVATSAYRIIQEALGNVAKHAQAKKVVIDVALKGKSLEVKVEDDGKGFAMEMVEKKQAEDGCSGLINMKERARFLGGNFLMEATPGKGTKLFFTIPAKETL